MKATFAGKCPFCEKRIEVGQRISRWRGAPGHYKCVKAKMARADRYGDQLIVDLPPLNRPKVNPWSGVT